MWWIKKGHSGRLAVVNYRPFPGEEAIDREFRYHTEAMDELERLERQSRLRRSAVQGFLLGLVLTLCMIVLPGCAHQGEFTEHYDDCMQQLNMERWQTHPGGYEARNACRVYAQREMR